MHLPMQRIIIFVLSDINFLKMDEISCLPSTSLSNITIEICIFQNVNLKNRKKWKESQNKFSVHPINYYYFTEKLLLLQ